MQVALATEDVLSEAVGLRLLSELPKDVQVGPLLRKDGVGYLRSKMSSWRQIAQRQPILVMTDLDRIQCPAVLRADWLGNQPIPPNLLLRIAVREIESWVLADHEAVRGLFGARVSLPENPDDLADPKQHLLRMARSAPREVRDDLVKQEKAVASQGVGYNARLCQLVNSIWSPERAAIRSPSLHRARERLRQVIV